ncbi:MAG: ABC transporter permease subunit [Pseudonocardiales bacterium]|nr:ABC transporter permease subunit [Pseudonocardiales bacterium]
MNLVGQIVEWFANPHHWRGLGGVPVRLAQHLEYSVFALLVAAAIAVPLGAGVGHTRRGVFLIVGFANGLRALPELGLLTLLVLGVGIGLVPVVVALAVLGIPPLLAGTYAGIRNVDARVVDAARGMGMRERQVLFKVELPNALPLMLGGLRAAALQVIATAVVAAYVSFGGLGRYLIDGLATGDGAEQAAGAVLVVLLALAAEGLLVLLQRRLVSPGLRAEPIGPTGAQR